MSSSSGIQETVAHVRQDEHGSNQQTTNIHDTCHHENNLLREKLISVNERHQQISAENTELKAQIERLTQKCEGEKTNSLYKEQCFSLTIKTKQDEAEAKDLVIKAKDAEIEQKNTVINNLEARKVHAQEQNTRFAEIQRRERAALDTVNRLQAEMETYRGTEAHLLALRTKYEQQKSELSRALGEVSALQQQNDRLKKRLSSGDGSRFSVEPVVAATSSDDSVFSKEDYMSTDVTPTSSSRENSPERSVKRGRFSSELVTSPKCKNCRLIIEPSGENEGPCSFHMSVPQPFSLWKESYQEKARASEYRNCLYWPCCDKFSRNTPAGCTQLRFHNAE